MNLQITSTPWDWTGAQGFSGRRFSRLNQLTRAALQSGVAVLFCAALAAGASAQTEQVLFNFSFDKTGWTPEFNGSTLVEPNDRIIGTAPFGGDILKGNGVVFEAIPPTKKNPDWHYEVIYRFKGGAMDGESPFDGVTLGNDGVIYGMTEYGGDNGCGVVYQLTPPPAGTTGKWQESVLYNFQGFADGCQPFGSQLLFDATTGSLYGTTEYGGVAFSQGYGTLFRLDPPAQEGDTWSETVLHTFSNGTDGAYPSGGLAGNPSSGVMYGTSNAGGSADAGVVWSYNISTGQLSNLYTFQGGSDGAGPSGGVIGPYSLSVQDNGYYLLGTTGGGGAGYSVCNGGCGTAFAIDVTLTSQGQTVTENQLHVFTGANGDGAGPIAGLTRAGGGAWGVAASGGAGSSGMIFEIQITSHISYTTLTYVPSYSFTGTPGDGEDPLTGLGADSEGNLYGMTSAGGNNDTSESYGAGTLFKFVP
ncbi:MAG: choice-of-anchor tandem repeat GloVer-containing protein [Steroidobacteraceae bacterium]|jgi:uncharacterized repeat protein (TIGR03803 family)